MPEPLIENESGKVSQVTISPQETLAAIERGVSPASLDEINGAIGFQISMREKESSNIAFLIAFTERMANAKRCPVKREMPDNMKQKLDEYLCRKRPEKK